MTGAVIRHSQAFEYDWFARTRRKRQDLEQPFLSPILESLPDATSLACVALSPDFPSRSRLQLVGNTEGQFGRERDQSYCIHHTPRNRGRPIQSLSQSRR